MQKVLITCAQMQAELPRHLDRMKALGLEVLAPPLPGQAFTSAELSVFMPGVVGMIAGDDELDSAFFASSPDLRVLIRWGIGMDSVDREAARIRNVLVQNTPGVFGDEVADSAMTYVLLLARRHHVIDASVRSGEWPKVEGISLAGASIGIIGLGDIGRSLVARAHGFGMSVMAYDPYAAADAHVGQAPLQLVSSLNELLEQARFVVLACPLTSETFHLINDATLSLMRRDAFLINVARGPVVDETALISALKASEIAGAGLDVFEVEPLPADSALRTLPQVILGAHNGSNTREGVARASHRAVDILLENLASHD